MFHSFLEKENASQVRVHAPVHSQVHATPAKIFQGNSEMQAPHRKALGEKNSQFFKTPKRAALKPVNSTPALSVHRANQQLMPAKPASQQPSQNWKQSLMEKQKKALTEAKPEVKVKSKEKKDFGEIEFAPPAPEDEDDFEDIWPKAERIESYLGLLHAWRPRKFAPIFEDPGSDSDSNDIVMVDLDDSLSEVAYGRTDGFDDFLPDEVSKPVFEEEPTNLMLDYVPLPPLDHSFDSFDS